MAQMTLADMAAEIRKWGVNLPPDEELARIDVHFDAVDAGATVYWMCISGHAYRARQQFPSGEWVYG